MKKMTTTQIVIDIICIAILLQFVVTIVLPSLKRRTFELKESNIYNFDIEDHFNCVKDAFDIESIDFPNIRIENLKILFNGEGEIDQFRYDLIWEQKSNKKLYLTHVRLDGRRWIMEKNELDSWTQYEKQIPLDLFSSKFNEISIDNIITEKSKDKNYGIVSFELSNFGIDDQPAILLKDGQEIPYNDKLPKDLYSITTYSLLHPSGSENQVNYVFSDPS